MSRVDGKITPTRAASVVVARQQRLITTLNRKHGSTIVLRRLPALLATVIEGSCNWMNDRLGFRSSHAPITHSLRETNQRYHPPTSSYTIDNGMAQERNELSAASSGNSAMMALTSA